MQNIRLSIALMGIQGARSIRMNDANNKPQVYVAIPLTSLFVPSDKPEPRLMLTAIHTPRAQYGDFMLKPYLSAEDYKRMSKEEQQNMPIVGKGTFMEPATNKELLNAAETVDVVDVAIPTTQTQNPTTNPTQNPTQPTNGSAAPLTPAPSPREAGSMSAAPAPMQPAKEFYVVDANHQSLFSADNWNDVAAFAGTTPLAVAIECWEGNRRCGRWTYDIANFSWNQVAV